MKKYIISLLSIVLFVALISCNDSSNVLPPPVVTSRYDASNIEDMLDTLSTYGQVRLTSDIEFSVQVAPDTAFSFPTVDGVAEIDLNGHTLVVSSNNNITVPADSTDIFRDGLLVINNMKPHNPNETYCDLTVGENSTLEMYGVTLNTSWGGILAQENNATIKIENSNIFSYGYYGVGTNASIPAQDINISIINSKIEVGNTVSELGIPVDESTVQNGHDPDGAAIFYNVNGELVVENSTIVGGAQAIYLRGCKDAVIRNSILIGGNANGNPDVFARFSKPNSWSGSGNMGPYATIVIGNNYSPNGKYPESTTCTIENTEIIVADDTRKVNGVPQRTVFVASTADHKVTLEIPEPYASSIKEIDNHVGTNIVINGVALQ